MARWQYIMPILAKYIRLQGTTCPHCGASKTQIVGTKYLILQLRKCHECSLMFRWPKDDINDNIRFYNKVYKEQTGITTAFPSEKELQGLIGSSFKNTNKDFTSKISLLKEYKNTGFVLDYGASWGYGMWQLQQAGYAVVGFEIDAQRAKYGREKLHLHIVTDSSILDEFNSSFDIIFTNHVLEHLPSLRSIFSKFNDLLRPEGVLIIFVPNCTGIEQPEILAEKRSFAFGEKHTFAFTAGFFRDNLPKYGFQVVRMSVGKHNQTATEEDDLNRGSELMVTAIKARKC